MSRPRVRRVAHLLSALEAIGPRPWLWPAGLLTLRRLAPRQWWLRWPPLPLPDADYLAFRMETAYGDPTALPPTADVVAYLEWCRAQGGAGRYRGA
ncbi:MAG TPA: hypothetical protein VMU63_08005 [Acidimicrobiales bacterium]|nr:hypothetical protein [Acidimicrobiales bacterium]